jgi:PAT family beta-lactamase induction signal transducer AmpG
MMQQISPGRYHMTHYAFCTALMNLVLIPTQMASGPLADWMGYRSYFVFVVIATIPSIVAAKLAPFPRAEEKPVSKETA